MSGIEPLLLGAAASGGTAATAGLFGAAGAFGLAQTLGTVGTLFGALGAFTQGQSESGAAEFNAQVAERNATIARQNAASDAQRERRLARIRAGANRAAAGASGGGVAGSALDLLEDNSLEESLNIATILHQGELKAQGFEINAGIDKTRAKNAKTRGVVGAGSQLLLGGAKVINA